MWWWLTTPLLALIITIEGCQSVKLFYGESHGISWTDTEESDRRPPLLTRMFMDVLGLDYHYEKEYLFYSGWETIWRMSLDDPTEEPKEIVKDAYGATSVAVDWVEDRVYWINRNKVQRTDLEGGHLEVVMVSPRNLSVHNNLVLDPYSRLLFLAIDDDYFLKTNLEDGTITEVKVEGHEGKLVDSLAIDVQGRRIYVSVIFDHIPYILSCDYDGLSMVQYDITSEWWDKFVAIDVFGSQLFWVNRGRRQRDTVWKANITVEGALTWKKEYTARGTILDPECKIWALKVYHSPPSVGLARPDDGESVQALYTNSSPSPFRAVYSTAGSLIILALVLLKMDEP